MTGNNEERVHEILLASAGIPGFFRREGSINTSSSTALSPATFFTAEGRVKTRASTRSGTPSIRAGPMPRVRYWVIFNNQFRFPPQVTQERWPDIMTRATIMASQTSTVNSMRHLFAQAESRVLSTAQT